MDELKPCPFCGGTNITMGAYSIAPECHIECECGARIELIVNFNAEMSVEEHDDLCAMELTKAWNQRAQQQDNKPLTLEKQLAEKESEIVRIRNSWSNTISDLSGVAAERDKYKASLDQIIRCAACKYAEPFPTDPRVLICANPKWVPTGDGRGVKEPYVKPDDYCSFGEEKDNEMDD